MNIEPMSAAFSNLTGGISQLVAHYKDYRDIKADEKAYIRLIYLEVLYNLEVLEMIKLDKLKSAKTNHRAFKELVDQLNVQILIGVFAPGGKKQGDLYKLLEKKGSIKYFGSDSVDEAGEEQVKNGKISTTVLRSIVFIVIKVQALQAASSIGEQEFMKQLVLKKRIQNIKERLLMLKSTIRDFDAMKGMI